MTTPRNIKIVNGCIYFVWKRKGKRTYRSMPALDHPDFDAAYQSAQIIMRAALDASKMRRPCYPSFYAVRRWNVKVVKAGSSNVIPAWLLGLVRESRKRALKRGLEFTISVSDMSLLYERSGGRCEMTGMPFVFEKQPGSLYRPFAPSIDRINPTEGYSFRNVRIVCVIVNAALNQWGEAPFWKMVQYAAGALEQKCLGPNFEASKSEAK